MNAAEGLVRRGGAVITAVAEHIGATNGWRRAAWLFGAGALATLSLPPVGFWPVLIIAFAVFFWPLQGAVRGRDAFAVGWWFGFGWLAIGLYWIANALLVFSDRLWWMVPFAALGLPAFLALFFGLAGWATRCVATPLARGFMVIVALGAADWLRGHVLTGFPWNLWGYGWADSPQLSQGAAWLGIYGLGLCVTAAAILPAMAVSCRGQRQTTGLLLLALLIPAAFWAAGQYRLSTAESGATATQTGFGIRLVQGGIPQRQKWAGDLIWLNFAHYITLSQEARPDWVSLVIWPETAAAFYLDEEPVARESVAAMLPPGGLLLTGAPRRQRPDMVQGDDAETGVRYHNSLLALDDTGRVQAVYDKAHLVPFGEYMPFRHVLPLDRIVHGAGDFSPGPGPRTLSPGGVPPFSPLICYEVIFPGRVISGAPRWILNITNDAWYGNSAGPWQHLAHARMRAIEQGLPLVRAANTGISAAFDGFGRTVSGPLELGRAGVLDFRLPMPVPVAAAPLYPRMGEGGFAGLMMLLLLAAFFYNYKESRNKKYT